MQDDDVERVLAAMQSVTFLNNGKMSYKLARAAMAATREIDAEALRKPAIGFIDHLDVADWLQQRAKEQVK